MIKLQDVKSHAKTWKEDFVSIFHWTKNNSSFVTSTYNSLFREYLKNFISSGILTNMTMMVNDCTVNKNISESDKIFMAHFFEYAFSGVLFHWIENGMTEDPENILSRIVSLFNSDILTLVNSNIGKSAN